MPRHRRPTLYPLSGGLWLVQLSTSTTPDPGAPDRCRDTVDDKRFTVIPFESPSLHGRDPPFPVSGTSRHPSLKTPVTRGSGTRCLLFRVTFFLSPERVQCLIQSSSQPTLRDKVEGPIKDNTQTPVPTKIISVLLTPSSPFPDRPSLLMSLWLSTTEVTCSRRDSSLGLRCLEPFQGNDDTRSQRERRLTHLRVCSTVVRLRSGVFTEQTGCVIKFL